MKAIKQLCVEIWNKVKERAAVITIFALVLMYPIGLVFKERLTTVYTLALPLWTWLLLGFVIVCPPAIVLKLVNIRRRSRVLTNEDDILNKLHWWVGQQIDFVREETARNRMVTWHFSVIDKRLRLNPGSTKKFLPPLFSVKPKRFPVKILSEGRETIALRYETE